MIDDMDSTLLEFPVFNLSGDTVNSSLELERDEPTIAVIWRIGESSFLTQKISEVRILEHDAPLELILAAVNSETDRHVLADWFEDNACRQYLLLADLFLQRSKMLRGIGSFFLAKSTSRHNEGEVFKWCWITKGDGELEVKTWFT